MTDERGQSEPKGRVPGRPEPTPPGERAGQPTYRGILAQLDPRFTRVSPGEVVAITVSVRNATPLVDEVGLRLTGEAAAWAQVAPDTLRLYPGTAGSAVIRLAPPKGSLPHAGLVTFGLSVSSVNQQAEITAIEGSIEVGAYDNLAVQPGASTELSGNRDAAFPINVTNLGNRATRVAARAANTAGAAVSLSPQGLTLTPGEQATVWARVKPRSRIWFGQAKIHPFTVSVSGDYAPPVSIDGRMDQRPVIGKGRLAALGTIVAAIAVGAAVLLLPGLLASKPAGPGPQTPGPSIAVAPTLLIGVGNTPQAPPPTVGPKKSKKPPVGSTDAPPTDQPTTPSPPPPPLPVTGPPGYSQCADVGLACTGLKDSDIAFGTSGLYRYLYDQNTDVLCDSSGFGGDPTGGQTSACFANAGPTGYWWCADEGASCSTTEPEHVAFGANAVFTFADFPAGSVDCRVQAIGGPLPDPLPGIPKACYISIPPNYTKCADEPLSGDAYCGLTVTSNVAFGFGGRFNFLYNQTGSVDCTDAVFGDPYPNQVKACYEKPV
jgi:hypothetical protein